MNEVAIETLKLSKSFDKGATYAVKDVSLSIYRGELFGLLGVNGAGKSTTIKMLSCLIKPTSGDALIEGRSILKNPTEIKSILDVSPQENAVAEKLSVYENLLMMAEIYGANKEEAKKRAEEEIKEFALEEVRKKKAGKLSGGYTRRLSIAMALVSHPSILFLDEPTLGLDVLARRELWKHIRALKGKITIVLTSHYMEEIEELSDRVGIINKGRLVKVGTAKGLAEETGTKNLEDTFVKIVEGE